MDTRSRALVAIALSALYLMMAQMLLAAPDYPGKGKLVVEAAPRRGDVGTALFYFKARRALESLSVTFELPAGLTLIDGDPRRTVGEAAPGQLVAVPCRFRADEMGIFRIGARASALDQSFSGGDHTWYQFLEVGVDQGWSPVVKPANGWQQRAKSSEPSDDDFVQIAKGVWRSPRTVTTSGGEVFEVETLPVVPTVGDVGGSLTLSEAPLLGRKVELTCRIDVREKPGRRGAPAELLLMVPPNSFRIHDVAWPEGGERDLRERGVHWRGPLPADGQLLLKVTATAQAPGEGKIRVLFNGQGRSGDISTEIPLFVEVNQHSARIHDSGSVPRG